MIHNYKMVNIYVDPNDNLLIVPTGHFEKYGGTKEIDLVSELNSPYNDNDLEKALKNAMEQCYTLKPDESLKETVLERYLKIKGYSKAVKNRKWIGLEWESKSGYKVIPSQKIPRKGYVFIKDKIIKLDFDLKEGELARAVKEAISISTS